MPQTIIHILKVIQIQEHQGELTVLIPGFFNLHNHTLIEQVAVGQAC